MNRTIVWAIARKDIRAVLSNSKVWLGLLLLPLLFSVILPGAGILLVKGVDLSAPKMTELVRMLDKLPAGELPSAIGSSADVRNKAIYMMANYMLGSIFFNVAGWAAGFDARTHTEPWSLPSGTSLSAHKPASCSWRRYNRRLWHRRCLQRKRRS